MKSLKLSWIKRMCLYNDNKIVYDFQSYYEDMIFYKLLYLTFCRYFELLELIDNV